MITMISMCVCVTEASRFNANDLVLGERKKILKIKTRVEILWPVWYERGRITASTVGSIFKRKIDDSKHTCICGRSGVSLF